MRPHAGGVTVALICEDRQRRKRAWLVRLAAILFMLLAAHWYVTGMPGDSWSGALPPLTEDQRGIHDRLQRHVNVLAGDIGERNVWRAGSMSAAAAYIRATFEASGLTVSEQPYNSRGQAVMNLEAILPGNTAADEIIVIGAHYDSVADSPGADDNASGVAALL